MDNQKIDTPMPAKFQEIVGRMESDLAAGPAIYQPSNFWKRLGRKNKDVLFSGGLEKFKRNVNQFYYQSLVTALRDPQFLSVLFEALKKFRYQPKYIFDIIGGFSAKIDNYTLYDKKTDKKYQLKWHQRLVYKWFIYLLYLHAKDNDKQRIFDRVSEPPYGDPVVLRGRAIKEGAISQDLCHSVLEANRILEDGRFDIDKPVVINEIGAGYGRLAQVILSILPKCRYVVTDIPPTLAVAQEYLRQCFPEKKIFFYRPFGDYEQVKNELERSDIIFLLPHQLGSFPDKYFDAVINISSFDEMRREQIFNWFNIIERQNKNLFYLKGWITFYNRDDDANISCIDYPIRPEWKNISFNVDKVNPKFFEASYRC